MFYLLWLSEKEDFECFARRKERLFTCNMLMNVNNNIISFDNILD